MVEIHGEVADGFEPVKRLFQQNMSTMAEDNAQLCVYVSGEKVVDLWASKANDASFDADSLVNIFSSGKSLESIALALLFERGFIEYSARIADYWPEFAAQGKADITVADLMRHEAGLAFFNTSIPPEHFHRENLKQNRVGAIIAEHPPSYSHESERREYHALTRGWIANEIVRRVHPEGKTIGEMLYEEVFLPLAVDVRIGLSEEELSRVSPIKLLSLKQHLAHTFTPLFLGRKVKHNIFDLTRNLLPVAARARRTRGESRPPPFTGMDTIADLGNLFNDAVVRMGETPSANTHASARGLARLAAMLAAKGNWNDREFLQPKTWEAMHGAPLAGHMMIKTNFSQGGVNLFKTPDAPSHVDRSGNQGREGFWGWMGLGGSIFQWHPEHDIGFGFVPTSLHALDLMNERGKAYQNAVVKCVRKAA